MKGYFKLEKLKINVYNNVDRSGMPQDTFIAMFNPESYSLKYENIYQSYQGINTSGREAKYSLSKPECLSFNLILDNTGVVDDETFEPSTTTFSEDSSRTQDINKKVEEFLELTCYMDGEIHQPKFLKIEWGNLNFDCRLQSVEVTYLLFSRSGQPIRANLDTVFVGDIKDVKRIKEENKNSPDLSHYRRVKDGDTLILLSEKVYGDTKYYLELAKVNNLNNFRKLKIGTVIKLPPIN